MHKSIKIDASSYARIMFIIKYFMKLHPEYNEMLMDFYAKLYDKCPIDVDEVLVSNIIKEEKLKDNGIELDEMIWNLGLSLPSWEDDSNPNNGKQQ